MPYGSVGGMERLAQHFYKHYTTQGYEVKALKFIALKSDIIHFDDDEFALLKKDLHEISFIQRILFYLLAPFKIRQLIKQNNITHSIAFGDMANIFSSLTYTSEYKIASIHALKSVELKNKSIFNSLIKLSYKTIYKNLNKVVCISHAIKEDIIEKCTYKPIKNLDVIYNPHDINYIQEKSKETLDTLEEELFKTKTILFIGRLSIQKSPWHLINAFNEIIKQRKDVNLVFIGDGDNDVQNYIKTLIKSYGIENNVVFLGRKKNPYKYLKVSNVLVLSSHFEGTPNVIVESIALGIPIVSSNCTLGISELMSLKPIGEIKNNTEVEAGIITPNLFKGTLGIPEENNLIKEEILLFKAIEKVLNSEAYKVQLKSNQEQLLEKFDLYNVTKQYLT